MEIISPEEIPTLKNPAVAQSFLAQRAEVLFQMCSSVCVLRSSSLTSVSALCLCFASIGRVNFHTNCSDVRKSPAEREATCPSSSKDP